MLTGACSVIGMGGCVRARDNDEVDTRAVVGGCVRLKKTDVVWVDGTGVGTGVVNGWYIMAVTFSLVLVVTNGIINAMDAMKHSATARIDECIVQFVTG